MDGERIQELFTAFITYMWEGARNGANWAKEHPVYAEYSNFASMDWERIKELFTAFIRYSWEAASNGAIWAEEHQEESENPYLVWAACVALALMLYALVRGTEALLRVIYKLVIVVLKLLYWLASASLNTLALQSSPRSSYRSYIA
ncbi:hypothetical protein K466DRAFT_237472 [Polyporus arcularius HHB13444]|uniref:Uncharacterized protein n=1 Tax=Polyporus arcularius HHB13444 TaxID=1314778 RepID=A0A5C3P692_9APHY|nr:hypothetical protein K466DRAFT_237472 [Polyporus arcularius HHB13444]